MPKMMASTATSSTTPIHSGESTHIHDHVMYPVNFRPMNRMVKRPTNPIPPLELDEDELDILNLLREYPLSPSVHSFHVTDFAAKTSFHHAFSLFEMFHLILA